LSRILILKVAFSYYLNLIRERFYDENSLDNDGLNRHTRLTIDGHIGLSLPGEGLIYREDDGGFNPGVNLCCNINAMLNEINGRKRQLIALS
jgi:hypothetical protein